MQFVVLLSDPKNQLEFESYSQIVPMSWLQIPEEDNFWVQHKLEDCLELCVSTIAQDYVRTRMHDAIEAINTAAEKQQLQVWLANGQARASAISVLIWMTVTFSFPSFKLWFGK